MATNFLWGPVGTVVHLLTTEMNTLASAAGTAYGPEFGGATKEQMGMLYLHIASNSTTFAGGCAVYLVSSTTTASGATYPTYTSGTSYKYSGNGYVGTVQLTPAANSANVVDEVLPGIIVPAGFFKCILVNNSGFALPASGNTLDFYPTPTQY